MLDRAMGRSTDSSGKPPREAKLIGVDGRMGTHLSLRIKRPGERRSLSRSATRALDVLEAFGQARRPLRTIDVARMLDITPSSANQLLKTMVDSAHLLFDARGKTYAPSPRLARFCGWIAELYGTDGRIGQLVRDVQQETGLVVTASTSSDLFMQIIDVAASGWEMAERGMQVSLFGSASGSAMLSMLDDAEIRRLAERARIPGGEVAGILASARVIREAGYADGPSTGSDIWSIAMPLPRDGLPVPAVLGLAGPSSQVCERLGDYCAIMRAAIARWFPG